MMLDDYGAGTLITRYEVHEKLTELMNEPFDEDEAFAYKAEQWAKQNVAAMEAQGMGTEGDEFMAKPVDHAMLRRARELEAAEGAPP